MAHFLCVVVYFAFYQNSHRENQYQFFRYKFTKNT